MAQVTCASDIGSGLPIQHINALERIICVNTEPRTNGAGDAIELSTVVGGVNKYIDLDNSGELVASQNGIFAYTNGDGGFINILNSGAIEADFDGIRALTYGPSSSIFIDNRAAINAGEHGIRAETAGSQSTVTIVNSGEIVAGAGFAGIHTYTVGVGNSISVTNRATISAGAQGIDAATRDAGSSIVIDNSGNIVVTGAGDAYGIRAETRSNAGNRSIHIENSARIEATGNAQNASGIHAISQGANNNITIVNAGDIVATNPTSYATGISARSDAGGTIGISNSGAITANGDIGEGIRAQGAGLITITNSGVAEGSNVGILALGGDSVTITNSGRVTSLGGPVNIAPFPLPGIAIFGIVPFQGNLVIDNSGTAEAFGADGWGIAGSATGPNSRVTILNSGTAYGAGAGIVVASNTGSTIVNSGDISAGSHRAIYAFEVEPFVQGASVDVFNTGRITGFVQLSGHDDRFLNQSGGVFATKLTSDFGGGSDLFQNQGGGTVQAATDRTTRETSAFVNLERFENAGLISLQDGQVGDVFEISNTVGQRNLAFAASGNSTLAVDAFLGGPGSTADNFVINGNISGKTKLAVNNTNPGPGSFNAQGIPVVYANGDVKPDAFFLDQPIDTGFFDYDLFFRPTGSGIFELRGFLGAGAFVLPQLTTAAQDLWHAGASTWFDRTADLRVLLAGGAGPSAYAPTGSKLDDGVQAPGAVPAVWMRGSGSWLDRDDSETVRAHGRTYQYNLDRELETFDFQVGLDLGTRDVLGAGDILVFGALGGFVHANLDYEQIARGFDLSGGQVGGYATYLNGGLFVDTLLNVHFLEVDTPVLGFPKSLDATTIGLRTDAGYRFGSFTGGAFIEPLATIAVTWADLDGFSVGGNTVSFDDDANVRGRLGLRVGTSYDVTTEVKMEPFVIGSVWGNLSGDTNTATLTSSGTAFVLKDQLDDVWGEVSAGVNFFNFGTGTTVFAKVDVTFGDDVSGVGGKAGMRVAW